MKLVYIEMKCIKFLKQLTYNLLSTFIFFYIYYISLEILFWLFRWKRATLLLNYYKFKKLRHEWKLFLKLLNFFWRKYFSQRQVRHYPTHSFWQQTCKHFWESVLSYYLLTPRIFTRTYHRPIDDEHWNWDCEIVDDISIYFVITTITMKRFNA